MTDSNPENPIQSMEDLHTQIMESTRVDSVKTIPELLNLAKVLDINPELLAEPEKSWSAAEIALRENLRTFSPKPTQQSVEACLEIVKAGVRRVMEQHPHIGADGFVPNTQELQNVLTNFLLETRGRRGLLFFKELRVIYVIGHSVVKCAYRQQHLRHRLILRWSASEPTIIRYKKGLSWRKAKKRIQQDLAHYLDPSVLHFDVRMQPIQPVEHIEIKSFPVGNGVDSGRISSRSASS